jgi:quercetin dioxygenase-like cupin family protein
LTFFDIEPIGEVPPHTHGAQWGVVLEGEMKLTIGDNTRTCRKGDWYYIPEGVAHGATFATRVQVIDFFADVDRYKPKTT